MSPRFLRTLVFKSPFLFELPLALDKSLAFEFSFKEHIITNPNNQSKIRGKNGIQRNLLLKLKVHDFQDKEFGKAIP